ncbi:phosphatase PAP2 family protein [Natronorubrum sp. FCH18a]|uniref:phosphatase PAP2 family protein n=1 Tax=Natronorubrum sp. FCH18a TaxID=3447018 RepID=UPI003F518972
MWFESAYVEAVRDAFPEWMAFCFAFLSYLGSVWFVVPITVSLYWFHDRHRFGPWLGVVVGCYGLMHALKGLFETPRPGVGPAIAPDSLPTLVAVVYAPLVEVGTTSFPSGHVLAATVVWTMLALEIGVGTTRRSLVSAAVIVVLVGIARIGAGLHFPIDVIAGAVAGVCYLLVVLAVRRREREWGSRATTSATFAIGAGLALLSFAIDPYSTPAALFGGGLGGLAVWRYAPPPRGSWSVTGRTVAAVLLGLTALALVGTVGAVVDVTLGWMGVGFAAGVIVVGLPRVVAAPNAPLKRNLADFRR